MPRPKKNQVNEGSENGENKEVKSGRAKKESGFSKVTLKLPNKVHDLVTNHFENNPGLDQDEFFSFMIYVGVRSSENAMDIAYMDYTLFSASNPFKPTDDLMKELSQDIVKAVAVIRERKSTTPEYGSPDDDYEDVPEKGFDGLEHK